MKSLRLSVVALGLAVAAFAVPVGAEEKEGKNIVQTAQAAGKFKTLLAAVDAAGLTETLMGKGPFTVFAPTDAAFAKLGNETIEAVLKDKEKLTAILKYHVVSGKVMAQDVVKLSEASTLNGTLPIKVDGETVMVGKAKVIKADVECSNGVVHVIDTVLLPPAK